MQNMNEEIQFHKISFLIEADATEIDDIIEEIARRDDSTFNIWELESEALSNEAVKKLMNWDDDMI